MQVHRGGRGPKKLKQRVKSYLWLGGGDPPIELLEVRLCRDVYHCLPSELAAESYDDIMDHLTVMEAEAECKNWGS